MGAPEGFALLTYGVELLLPIPMTGVGIKGKTGPKALKGAAGMDQCKMNSDQRRPRLDLRKGSDKGSTAPLSFLSFQYGVSSAWEYARK